MPRGSRQRHRRIRWQRRRPRVRIPSEVWRTQQLKVRRGSHHSYILYFSLKPSSSDATINFGSVLGCQKEDILVLKSLSLSLMWNLKVLTDEEAKREDFWHGVGPVRILAQSNNVWNVWLPHVTRQLKVKKTFFHSVLLIKKSNFGHQTKQKHFMRRKNLTFDLKCLEYSQLFFLLNSSQEKPVWDKWAEVRVTHGGKSICQSALNI